MAANYRVVPVGRSHVGLIVLVVICVAIALGFYLNWFKVSHQRETITNKVDVNLSVDTDKMKRDVRNATDKTEQKASELSKKVKQEATELKARATNKGS
jgi:hypothetical protein